MAETVPSHGLALPEVRGGWRRASLGTVWLAALAVFAVLWLAAGDVMPWAFDYPRAWQWPLARWINAFMGWLVNDAAIGPLHFTDVTRALARLIEIPYDAALSFLATGLLSGQGSDAIQLLPPLSWIAVIGIVALLGLHAGGPRLAVLVGACFVFIAAFGQWQPAMVTLASILIAVPIGVVGGLLLGLAGFRWPAFERALTPALDLMQTVPVFAYLVPILFLFGFGPVSAIVATIIYAMPPMTRITMLALRGVAAEVVDLGRMVGCSRRQMTWRVMVPSATAGLMVGVNQVIMLSLNMVIIASMIGAGGLGYEVLAALRRLDIGAGMEAGFAIVALAIALDRLSQAFAARAPAHRTAAASPLWLRYPYTAGAGALVLVTAIGGLAWGGFQSYPEGWHLTTGSFWSDVVRWININFFDTLEAIKSAVLLNLLIPFKRFLLDLPWLGVVGLVALAGYMLGGVRIAAVVTGLSLFIAATGQWENAMVTVYLCGISVMFACLIGIPIGIAAAGSERVWGVVRVIVDTLQTLPSFVYLMPAVMLFRVGDFTAMIAVVAYSVAPAIRYTAHGLRQIDPQLVEAGIAAGCTPRQIMTKIKLKLALPEIMLGINQTIMLALSMLVITALVGTRDLGQEVYIALTKADTGHGIVAGLCVAFIAIIADRLISAGSQRIRLRLGLAGR
jgi:glycine betaine/proline transport system permease protein